MNSARENNGSRGTVAGGPRAATRLAGLLAALFLALAPLSAMAEEAAGDNAAHAVAAEHQGAGEPQQDRQAAADEHGSEHQGGEHEAGPPSINFKTLGLQLLNFAVLLFILVKFGGAAINKGLAARHQQLKADLAAAADLRALAEVKLSKQEARLASLETEIAEMRSGIKAEAAAEKARLIAAAEERAARIKAETTFLVDQQVREAEGRLRRESADTALKVAEEILRRAIGTGDQQRLLDTFVTDVEQPAAAAAGSAGTAGRAA